MLWNGNECGKKSKVVKISRQTTPVETMINLKKKKQVENVE